MKLFFFMAINSFLIFLGTSIHWLTTLYQNCIYLYFLYLLKTYILDILTSDNDFNIIRLHNGLNGTKNISRIVKKFSHTNQH